MNDALLQLQQFWDQRYSVPEFVYGTQPNQFLTQQMPRILPGGRVLCLADGEGRNGVWLALQGFAVRSVDVSAQGVEKTLQLARQSGVPINAGMADVTTLDMGMAHWDAIVSIFLHLPSKARAEVHRRAMMAIKPGGVFLWEAYAPQQLALGTGGPKEARLLPGLADVAQDFSGSVVLHSWSGERLVQEGNLHTGVGAVTQLVVQKPLRSPSP